MNAGTGFQLNFTAPQMPVSNPGVSGTFNFTITINGVQLQQ